MRHRRAQHCGGAPKALPMRCAYLLARPLAGPRPAPPHNCPACGPFIHPPQRRLERIRACRLHEPGDTAHVRSCMLWVVCMCHVHARADVCVYVVRVCARVSACLSVGPCPVGPSLNTHMGMRADSGQLNGSRYCGASAPAASSRSLTTSTCRCTPRCMVVPTALTGTLRLGAVSVLAAALAGGAQIPRHPRGLRHRHGHAVSGGP